MRGMWLNFVVWWFVCAISTGVAAYMRNRSVLEGIVLGFLLNGFGFLIEITLPAGPPKPPEGTFSEQCDYCNAIQNVSIKKPEYECWRCGTTKKFRLVD